MCCVPEPHGEGTLVLDVVPMMQQLLGCVECVSWQVLLGGKECNAMHVLAFEFTT